MGTLNNTNLGGDPISSAGKKKKKRETTEYFTKRMKSTEHTCFHCWRRWDLLGGKEEGGKGKLLFGKGGVAGVERTVRIYCLRRGRVSMYTLSALHI